jgi:hypothetical protein
MHKYSNRHVCTHQQADVLCAASHAAEVAQHRADVPLQLLGQQVGVVGHDARPDVVVLQATWWWAAVAGRLQRGWGHAGLSQAVGGSKETCG